MTNPRSKGVTEREKSMSEQIETEQGTTPEAATSEDSSYREILAGEASTPQATDEVQPEAEVQPAPQDPEFTLQEGKKAKLSEILEWQKGYLRQQDYTKKTQEISEFRKSLEESFGRQPQIDEIKALGKLVQSYYRDPKAQEVINAILSGNFKPEAPSNQAKDSNTQALEQKIATLEEQLSKFTQSIEEREMQKLSAESQKTWESWVAKKQQENKSFQVTPEVDQAMGVFIDAITKKHPDWNDMQVLDEAYKHATIGELETQLRSKLLKSADKSKETNPPKINPKNPQKTDSDMSYKEIFLGAQT